MKSTAILALAAAVLLAAYVAAGVGESTPPGQAVELKSVKDKVSYSIGASVGRNLKAQMIEVDPKVVLKGIEDGIAGGKLLLTDAEMRDTMMGIQKDLAAKQEAAGAKTKAEGDAYLAENAKKPGVVVLPSGLQYKVLTEGTGPKPKATDTVTTHYRGTLIDGTEFDSSYARGEPAEFPVKGVIKGWTEALQLMPVGSKWQLFIPGDLAYGKRGSPPKIGQNAVLVFEIELIGIK